MAEQVLKDVGIWIDGVDYAGVSNSVGIDLTAAAPVSTRFKGGWVRRAAGGLKTAALSMEGFLDTDGPGAAQYASLGTEKSVMIVPAGQVAGDVAFIVPVAVSAHSPLGGGVGELAAWTYAAEGDGPASRAQVLDIREGVTADNVTARVNLGPIATGETLEVWVHVTRRAGRVQISVESATNQTTGTATTRGGAAGINTTRVEKYSIAGPVTDEWWQLRYDFSVGSPDFDFASAAAIG